MKILIMLALLLSVSVYAEHIIISTPQGSIQLETPQGFYTRNQSIKVGLISENINIRLKRLDDIFSRSQPQDARHKVSELLKEIRLLVSLLPAEAEVSVKADPLKQKDNKLKAQPILEPIDQVRPRKLKYLDSNSQ